MPEQPTRGRQLRGPRVHIVGGGISGLVAALRLAQRGYRVIVYEERNVLGGNVGGFEKNGYHYDVYPHMFGDFYANFWDLAEGDLRMRRGPGRDFEPHDTFKILDRGKFPHYIDLLNVAAPLSNYFSGVASPAYVLLGVYSLLDGLSYGHSDDAVQDLAYRCRSRIIHHRRSRGRLRRRSLFRRLRSHGEPAPQEKD